MKEGMITLTSNSFEIKDVEKNALCFKAKGKLLTLHHRKYIEDNKGNQIIEMEHAVFTLHRQVKLLAGPKGNTTVAIARSKAMTGMRSDVSVLLGDKVREEQPDISAKGSLWFREFTFHNREGDVIAQVTRKVLTVEKSAANDSYILHVAPDVDSALMVALVLCIEEMFDAQKNK